MSTEDLTAKIQVSNGRRRNFYVAVAKRMLREAKDRGDLDADEKRINITALGSAVPSAISLVDMLETQNIMIRKQITTDFQQRQSYANDSYGGSNQAVFRKPRITILLEKHPDFVPPPIVERPVLSDSSPKENEEATEVEVPAEETEVKQDEPVVVESTTTA